MIGIQRRFEFPNRCIAWTPDRVEWDARAGLAGVTFDFEPAVSAVEALRDGRRGLACRDFVLMED